MLEEVRRHVRGFLVSPLGSRKRHERLGGRLEFLSAPYPEKSPQAPRGMINPNHNCRPHGESHLLIDSFSGPHALLG